MDTKTRDAARDKRLAGRKITELYAVEAYNLEQSIDTEERAELEAKGVLRYDSSPAAVQNALTAEHRRRVERT